MDGRVKTLHPTIHGGILARRDDAGARRRRCRRTASRRSTSSSSTSTRSRRRSRAGRRLRGRCIENIDIGGPAMIRAAAKNHDFVAVVTDPADYDARARRASRRTTGATGARRCASGSPPRPLRAPPPTTPRSSQWFARRSTGEALPARASCSRGELPQTLRYGENPHQQRGVLRRRRRRGPASPTAPQVQGKELSLQQPHRRRRRLRAASPSSTRPAVVDHQARQPVRRRRRRRRLREAYGKALRLRSGQRLRRHRRAQPPARRRDRRRDRRDSSSR